jgi:hypothetical protein
MSCLLLLLMVVALGFQEVQNPPVAGLSNLCTQQQ